MVGLRKKENEAPTGQNAESIALGPSTTKNTTFSILSILQPTEI